MSIIWISGYMEKTGSKLEEVLKPVNAIHHHFEEIEKIIDNSTYNNIVNNNQPSIVLNGGINITCPGVRDPEVMRNLHIYKVIVYCLWLLILEIYV